MRAHARAMRRADSGASVVEYSFIVLAIAAVLVLALLVLGRLVGGQFSSLDCWTSTGCTQSMPATGSPAPAAPVQQASIPDSALAANQPSSLCNSSSNGNGKGQGAGHCK